MRITVSAVLALLAMPLFTAAQTHPLAFGTTSTSGLSNWYKDYAGTRLIVLAPAALAGEKHYTVSNDGSGSAAVWGAALSTPIINKQIIMPQAGDSLVSVPITVSMTGKVAMVYRGGGIDYSAKALEAQSHGALACIVVNNVPGEPVGMAAGVSGSSVTIPVFMISKADGDALDAQYCSGVIPSVSITPWGQNYGADLGFVPKGISKWSNYATPSKQMFNAGSQLWMKGLDGAFVANYGTHNITHVSVTSTLKYTPTGGSVATLHTTNSATLNPFPASDSIYAFFGPASGTGEYTFAPSGTSGTGRFDLTYTINSDSATHEVYTGDNTTTYSFYTTDSVYSKGRYDFTNNMPVCQNYLAPVGGGEYLWGPMYYVSRNGMAMSSAQFSVEASAPGSLVSAGLFAMNVWVLKWVDGSGGQPLDGYVQNGEMTNVAYGFYNFTGTDTSGGVFKCQLINPVVSPAPPVMLDSGSWYFVAADVPPGYYLGVDGDQSPYPRIYGRKHVSSSFEYNNILWPGSYSFSYPFTSYPAQAEAPCAFPGTYLINSVDSFNYSELKGVIPAVTLITNNNPIVTIVGSNEICIGDSTGFADAVTGGTWTSSNPAVATIGSTTGMATGVSAGTTIITYAISATNYGIIALTVDPVPVAGSLAGPSAVCVGSTITLTDAYPGGTWTAMPGHTSVSSSGVVTGLTTGVDHIYYDYSNTCGFISDLIIVTVDVMPSAGSISGPSAVCAGTSITLTDGASGGIWTTAGSNATVSGGIVTGVSGGPETISYTVASLCASVSATSAITVYPQPAPVITVSGLTLSTTVPFTSYQWQLGGAPIGGATNATYDVTLNGAYSVFVTDANGCTATSALSIVSNVGVAPLTAGSEISVYPNPTNGLFAIHTDKEGTVTLSTIDGREIVSYHVDGGNTSLRFPQGLSAGVYTCRYKGNDGSTAIVKITYEP